MPHDNFDAPNYRPDDFKPIRDALDSCEAMLKARGKTPEIEIQSIPALNQKIWGIHRGKLTVIAARTSNGKTALATQLAWDAARQGIPVLYLSLEMYKDEIIERIFCQVCKIDNIALLTGGFADYQTEWEQFRKLLATVPLIITDMIGKDWKQIRALLESLPTKPSVIFIDHVQEAKDESKQNDRAVITEYVKAFRVMAKEMNFAAIVLSQVNRAAQEEDHREPQLHHLKGTGYLEEGADIILLLHWPFYYSKKRGERHRFIIRVAKNRNGRTGWIDVTYTPENYLFSDYVPDPPPPDRTVKEVDPESWKD